jgi:hypothetical protein
MAATPAQLAELSLLAAASDHAEYREVRDAGRPARDPALAAAPKGAGEGGDMSETWDTYYQDDAASVSTAEPEVDTAVTSDLDSAAVADDWSSWNESTADENATYSSNDYDAGVNALAEGDTQGAEYDFNIASNEADVADSHAATADDYATTADQYTAEAESTETYDSGDGDYS